MNKPSSSFKAGNILKAINDISTYYNQSPNYISKGNCYKIVNIINNGSCLSIHILDLKNNNVKEIFTYELNNFINLGEHRDKIINDLLDGK